MTDAIDMMREAEAAGRIPPGYTNYLGRWNARRPVDGALFLAADYRWWRFSRLRWEVTEQ
jgi:hypothetical protein